MLETIHRLNQMASTYLSAVADRHEAAQISEATRRYGERKVPIYVRGMYFTPEGAESHLIGAEKIDVGAALPAKSIRWDLPEASYRIALKLDGPGWFSAFSGGKEIITARRTSGTAVVDVKAGSLEVAASEFITSISVFRFEARKEGELILGPFTVNGSVSGRVIGHGEFTCELAHDYDTGKRLDLSGLEPVVQTGGELPWSVMQRYDRSLAAPAWDSALLCGDVVTSTEKLTLETTTEMDLTGQQLWTGLDEWRRLPASEAPAFQNGSYYWTFVWGRAEGYDLAYDVRTGRRADASKARGFYLIGAADTAAVRIAGTAAAYGEPLRYADDAQALPGAPLLRRRGNLTIVPPGTYEQLHVDTYPRQVLVRVRGRGILRGVELTIEESLASPDATRFETTRREDLAAYWGDEDPAPQRGLDLSGPGIMMLTPHNE